MNFDEIERIQNLGIEHKKAEAAFRKPPSQVSNPKPTPTPQFTPTYSSYSNPAQSQEALARQKQLAEKEARQRKILFEQANFVKMFAPSCLTANEKEALEQVESANTKSIILFILGFLIFFASVVHGIAKLLQ